MSQIVPDFVASSPGFPRKVDVVVIGGGIAGVSTALALAERGVSVALCEKGVVAGEQSGRNWGWTRQAGRDPAEIPLASLSLELWRGMHARIGEDVGFRQTGTTYLCRNTRQEAEYEKWLPHARACGIDSRMLRREELHRHLPGVADDLFTAAMHTSSDGSAEPLKATPAMARAAIRAGAHVLTGCAVRTVERSAGRVSGVVTEKGPIACSSVVLAGGAWSRLFAGNLGIDFPQLKLLGTVARVAGVAGVPDLPIGADNFAFNRRVDGSVTLARRAKLMAHIVPDSFRLFLDFVPNLVTTWGELNLRIGNSFVEEWKTPRNWAPDEISPFERVRILDPQPVESLNRECLANVTKAFPGFAEATIVQSWAGLIDVTPDAVPVIGQIETTPGFFIASGFSGHGFGLGPGVGQLMAEIVMGTLLSVDPSPFRFDRFRRSRLKS